LTINVFLTALPSIPPISPSLFEDDAFEDAPIFIMLSCLDLATSGLEGDDLLVDPWSPNELRRPPVIRARVASCIFDDSAPAALALLPSRTVSVEEDR